MTRTAYVRYELLRSFRNRRFILFSLAYPLVLFFAIAEPNRHAQFDGVAFPLYFMGGMAAVGTMIAVVSSGARIAAERASGWTRQMRITPLPTGAYFGAKVLCGYLTAFVTIVSVGLAGSALGVRLSAGGWLTVLGLLLVGLVPFVVLGIGLGHVLSTDSLAVAAGGVTVLFALLGGAYGFLIAKSGAIFEVIKALPSYWLVQAGKTAFRGGGWPAEGWIVVAVWTALLVPLAVVAYRRDTSQV
jgi:ABC-2 type transport system permease protein